MERVCKVCGKVVNFGSKTTSFTCDSCIQVGLKYCNTCGKIKPIGAFTVKGTTVNGAPTYESSCKDCIREYKRVYQKRYNKTEKGNASLRAKNIRRNRHNGTGDLTAMQWQGILELFEFRCAYCGSTEKLSMEHIIPVSKGGALTKANIIVACQHCNSSRGNKKFDEWLTHIPESSRAKILWYINEGHKAIE